MNKVLVLISLVVGLTSYAQSLKSPAEFLGYETGEAFTPHWKMVEYMTYLAENHPDIKLEKYGETYEGRPLILLTISSGKNMVDIEKIRMSNLALTGLEKSAEEPLNKAIVWMSYNVHGNESVSMESSMLTLYELATNKNPNSKKWLENTVVIIDPCINPDGRDRYYNFYIQNKNANPNPDINSKEHREPWPGGRTNHYLFDLNRDWAWLKQKESKARIVKYHEWMPHVHVDFHEQGINSPYYFAPAAEPLHELITPWQKELQTLIGKNHATYFDKENWLYFTKEVFDLLYPSYGDTYPTFNGSVGMTYEQGGSGAAGLKVETEFGDLLTLKDRILHHHTTGLSTIETTSRNAEKVIAEFKNYFEENNDRFYKSFLIKGSNNPDKIRLLKELLDAHKIQYGKASPKSLKGYNYNNKVTETVSAEPGDLFISTNQPKSKLVSVLFEPDTKMTDTATYDITSWSLPYVYGLDAYALTSDIDITGEHKIASESLDIKRGSYAYILPWESFQDAKFLAGLQSEGIKVRATSTEITLEGNVYPAGSIIITQRNNEGQNVEAIVKKYSDKFNRKVYSVSTGFSDSGIDIGSNGVEYIEKPKVALLGGEQTYPGSFGEVWYYFEQELNYQITTIDSRYFNGLNLDKYNVFILPEGSYSNFEDAELEKVQKWVSSGGRLILIGSAMNKFKDKEGWSVKTYYDDEQKEYYEEKEKGKSNPLKKYGDADAEGIKSNMPGAIYKIRVDNTHPLAFGYRDFYFSLKNSGRRVAYLQDGWNVGTIDKAEPVSGFAGSDINQKMDKTLVFGVENKGRGEVVYFVDNPLFRSFWENGKLLFANAVFMTGL